MPAGRSPAEIRTAQTRAWEHQVDKLVWLWKLKRIASADFIGPRIESDLDAEYEKIRPLVEQLEAQAELAAAHAPDLGNPVA